MDKETELLRSLREIRKTRGLTQSDVGEIMGMHVNGVWSLENGRQKTVRLSTVLKYCEAIGVDLSVIYKPIQD